MSKNYTNSRRRNKEEKLKRMAFKSPAIGARVRINAKTSMVPNRVLKTEADVENWRNEMKLKYGLR